MDADFDRQIFTDLYQDTYADVRKVTEMVGKALAESNFERAHYLIDKRADWVQRATAARRRERIQKPPACDIEEVLLTPLADVPGITVRQANQLELAGVFFLGELLQQTPDQLRKIPYFAGKNVNQLREAAKDFLIQSGLENLIPRDQNNGDKAAGSPPSTTHGGGHGGRSPRASSRLSH